jgi:hypothetical protein
VNGASADGDGSLYESGVRFARTQAERDSPELAWRMPDRRFFAAGACHILASAFLRQHPEGFWAIFLRPLGEFPGQHVFVTDGYWALDAGGWTSVPELLAVTSSQYGDAYPGWDCRLELIDVDLREFCVVNGHRLPEQFAHSPWRRANRYLRLLGDHPMVEVGVAR